MANGNTQFAKDSFMGLPPWAKGAIAVAIVGGIGYLIYKTVKLPGQIQEDKSKREEDKGWNQEFDKLNSNPATKATLTKAQMSSIANKIHTAMDGYGTDELGIVAAFKQIKNNADFAGVQAAYGIKTVSSGRLNPEPDFRGPMIAALTSELSQYWKDLINKSLTNKKIKYQV